MSNERTGAATVRPPGTVRFRDASLPDDKPINLEEERPYEVPKRDTKARNRRFKQIQWVVRDLQKVYCLAMTESSQTHLVGTANPS